VFLHVPLGVWPSLLIFDRYGNEMMKRFAASTIARQRSVLRSNRSLMKQSRIWIAAIAMLKRADDVEFADDRPCLRHRMSQSTRNRLKLRCWLLCILVVCREKTWSPFHHKSSFGQKAGGYPNDPESQWNIDYGRWSSPFENRSKGWTHLSWKMTPQPYASLRLHPCRSAEALVMPCALTIMSDPLSAQVRGRSGEAWSQNREDRGWILPPFLWVLCYN
jgi:hypothetical protein